MKKPLSLAFILALLASALSGAFIVNLARADLSTAPYPPPTPTVTVSSPSPSETINTWPSDSFDLTFKVHTEPWTLNTYTLHSVYTASYSIQVLLVEQDRLLHQWPPIR